MDQREEEARLRSMTIIASMLLRMEHVKTLLLGLSMPPWERLCDHNHEALYEDAVRALHTIKGAADEAAELAGIFSDLWSQKVGDKSL